MTSVDSGDKNTYLPQKNHDILKLEQFIMVCLLSRSPEQNDPINASLPDLICINGFSPILRDPEERTLLDVFVDADGCPVLEDVLEIVDNHKVHVVHNRHHQITINSANVTTYETGDRPDEADHYIYNHISSGDLVITDDLGLAGLVLARGALVIRFRGDVVGNDQIDQRLSMRHAAAKARRDRGHGKGPSAFTEKDRNSFCKALKQQLKSQRK